jgi:chemotaxis protein methyltransferase WspC
VSQAAIEALLRQKIGLDAETLGSSVIARAVHQRMADCGLSELKTYLARLKTSSDELEALIENVVVPETWFFRERESFAFLSQYVKTKWIPTHPDSILRVLSVPSSTGEEAYSIAIALSETGLSSKDFIIDAVDISKEALRKAKRAVYTQNSFRGDTLALRKAYFTQTAEGYQLSESVRSTVNFIHGNLLEPQCFKKTPYHVIFCRNLLIYLDRSAREQTIEILDRLLTKNGLLFVGHSETTQLPPSRFVSVRHPLAFAFRKLEESREEKEIQKPGGKGSFKSQAKGKKAFFSTKPAFSQVAKPDLSNTPVGSQTSKKNPPQQRHIAPKPSQPITDNGQKPLETARGLADRGQLNEAATLCETYLSQNQISAEAYFLLGQVRQAQGWEEQALQCFNKAIYIKPNYYEALIHLALLKEHYGDFKGAGVIRQRIQRLNQ